MVMIFNLFRKEKITRMNNPSIQKKLEQALKLQETRGKIARERNAGNADTPKLDRIQSQLEDWFTRYGHGRDIETDRKLNAFIGIMQLPVVLDFSPTESKKSKGSQPASPNSRSARRETTNNRQRHRRPAVFART
ncbi:hypothetical protein FWF89_02435 [Candidatus Saccharibacteria bacterium]|nr:hypothetical protein [Candidatus Saccharibacteria bacterium]